MNALLLIVSLLDTGKVSYRHWTRTDLLLGIASSAAIVADWNLAVDAQRRGQYEELNPVIRHRSLGSLNTYNALALIGNLLIANWFPKGRRSLWLAGMTGLEVGRAWHGTQIGLHFTLRL